MPQLRGNEPILGLNTHGVLQTMDYDRNNRGNAHSFITLVVNNFLLHN